MRDDEQSPAQFQGSENALRETMVVGTCGPVFAQAHGMHPTRVSCSINHGLPGATAYQCRLIHHSKRPALEPLLVIEGRAGVGAGGISEIFVPSTQFHCELKLL